MSTNCFFDSEHFITVIENEPAIWNSTLPVYTNKKEKCEAWLRICELFSDKFYEKSEAERNLIERKMQRRWKSLRDCFIRERNRMKSEPETGYRRRYLYFNQLSFLNEIVDSRKSSNDLDKHLIKEIEKFGKELSRNIQKKSPRRPETPNDSPKPKSTPSTKQPCKKPKSSEKVSPIILKKDYPKDDYPPEVEKSKKNDKCKSTALSFIQKIDRVPLLRSHLKTKSTETRKSMPAKRKLKSFSGFEPIIHPVAKGSTSLIDTPGEKSENCQLLFGGGETTILPPEKEDITESIDPLKSPQNSTQNPSNFTTILDPPIKRELPIYNQTEPQIQPTKKEKSISEEPLHLKPKESPKTDEIPSEIGILEPFIEMATLDSPKPPLKTTNPIQIETESEFEPQSKKSKTAHIEEDEDKMFLLSLLSDFKKISPDFKLDSKLEIIHIIKKWKNATKK